MELLHRARTDLTRPAAPVGRDLFLVGSALLIVGLAQWTDPGSPAELAALLPAVVAFVLLGLGARIPMELFAALVILPVTAVVGHEGNLEGAFFLPIVMTLYASWHLGSTIRATLVVLAAAATPGLVAEVLVPEAGIGWTPWMSANVFTFAMGLTLRRQRTLIQQLQEAREALAHQAVAEERRRIARELHDLAGHTLSAMMLHVTGARHVLERDPAEAQRALLDAEQVGRASLDQIRATVAALRTDEHGTDPSLAGAADVADLVEAYRRAGLRVDAQIDADAAQLDGPVGTAVHRIVRESLVNVARHAPSNRVEVTVRVGSAGVEVVVSDHGRRPPPHDGGGSHFGVIGMRERARALGGELSAGPHRDGWGVRARLPLLDRAVVR